MRKTIAAAMAAVWVAWMAPAAAQDSDTGIVVTGEGQVALVPDMATIRVGVRHRADTAQAAADQVGADMAQVIALLETAEVDARDRQTQGFFLRPVYDNRPSDGAEGPRITGFEAGNTLSVRVRDLDRLGTLVGIIVDQGANEFDGLSFGLQDPAEAQARARALAVADARDRAAQLADAAGVTLGQVLSIRDGGARGREPVIYDMARSAAPESIATGEVAVTAQVSMVFSIAPAR